jgi:hypothetical protein
MMIPQKCSKKQFAMLRKNGIKIEPLELEEVSSRRNSDISIEFRDDNDYEGKEREDIVGLTTTI